MNILRFAHPEYLYALIAVPVIVILFFSMMIWRRKAYRKFGDISLLEQLAPDVSRNRPVLKMILFVLAYTLIIIGLANPQIGSKYEEVKREGVDVIIALDVSNSMRAEDIRPNRLERSKLAISRFIDKLENDRIGLIVFAGQAYVQLPITTDFNAAKLFLSTISTDMIPTQGTAIGAAINLGMTSFAGNEKKHKVMVIITDGENHEDDAVEAAKKANEDGIIIHTIGMGTPNGGPIPVYHSGTQVDFLKDNTGSIVLTRLDQTALEQIAAEGKGIFVRASNSDDGLETIMKEIGKMDKKAFESKMFTEYEDRFQYLIGAGLVILLLEFLLSNKKSKWWHRLNLFKEGK
jgi:Ca-activated chloride channel family protein